MKRLGDKDCKITRRKTVATVTIGGHMTIGRATMLKEVFQKALADAIRIRLNISKCKTADPSFFQLVCSLHRTALATGKQVEIAGDLPKPLASLLKDVGFLKKQCHIGENTGPCLWDIDRK